MLTTPVLGVVCHPYLIYPICSQNVTILTSDIAVITETPKNLDVSHDLITPISWVCHPCLPNLKSISTHYKNMKGDKNKKMGWFWILMGYSRSPKIAPFDRAHEISY